MTVFYFVNIFSVLCLLRMYSVRLSPVTDADETGGPDCGAHCRERSLHLSALAVPVTLSPWQLAGRGLPGMKGKNLDISAPSQSGFGILILLFGLKQILRKPVLHTFR